MREFITGGIACTKSNDLWQVVHSICLLLWAALEDGMTCSEIVRSHRQESAVAHMIKDEERAAPTARFLEGMSSARIIAAAAHRPPVFNTFHCSGEQKSTRMIAWHAKTTASTRAAFELGNEQSEQAHLCVVNTRQPTPWPSQFVRRCKRITRR